MKKLPALLLMSFAIPAYGTTWNAKTSWGATGDGTTNDAPAIQTGVSHITAGDTIVFPAGTYIISTTVNFSASAIITCQSGAILQAPNTGTDVFANLRSGTTVGGSPTTGCIFNGGGVQASGSGGDNGQTLSQAVTNLTFTYNTFENMTYAPNNFRTNGGIGIFGGSNDVVIRYNTFSNIIPYSNGYNSAGSTYLEQLDPDGDLARAAIWFYGASNLTIDHNTFSHVYQNIKGCQAQNFVGQNILIHHNYSDSHHRMFLEINSGYGCGGYTGASNNQGLNNFQLYDNFDNNAGGPYPYSLTFGFSFPFAAYLVSGSTYASVPTTGMVIYNNLFKGVVYDEDNAGIGMEAGGQNMNLYNNTVMSQWGCAGCGFSGSNGGYMQNNYACIMTPAQTSNAYYTDEDNPAPTTITYSGNIAAGACPSGNASLSVSLGTITNTSGTLTGTATINTTEYGMQGVVFKIDGVYASASMGAGPYNLNYSAMGLSTGSHTVTATVVDAVGVPATSNSQTVSTTNGVGPTAGPISPNLPPSSVAFDIAGNATDPINGTVVATLRSAYLGTTGGANTTTVGGTLQFTANCVYSDGSITSCNNPDSHGNSVTAWSSSNTTNVTINGSGLATAVAAGTANIQATITGGITSSAWGLTVNATAVTLSSISLAITGGVSSIMVGATNQLIATCQYSDGSTTICSTIDSHGNSVSSWGSSAPTIATVNGGGLVTGVAVGSTNLSATVAGISNTSPFSIAVAPPTMTSAYLGTTGGANTMTVGGTLQFSAYCVYPSAATNCTVADIYGNAVTTWSTSDATEVTIGAVGAANPGLATAIAVGTPSIQATIGSRYSSPWTLTISNPPVTLSAVSLATTGGLIGLFVGSTNNLIATCTYSDSSTTNCTTVDSHGNVAGSYSSSNTAYATVNAVTGLITGVAAGTTNLTATAGTFTSPALGLTVLAAPTGAYTISISGPVTFSGAVSF